MRVGAHRRRHAARARLRHRDPRARSGAHARRRPRRRPPAHRPHALGPHPGPAVLRAAVRRAGNVWHVYGPRGLDTSIDKTLAGQMQYTYFPVQLLDFGATIEYHDLVEGQFEIDDVTVTTRYLHHPALTLGYRIEADGVDRRVLHGPRADASVGAPGPEGCEDSNREDALHIAFLRDADLAHPRRAVPRRGVPRRRSGGATARSSTRSTSRWPPTSRGSRCSTTTRPAPTTKSTTLVARARAASPASTGSPARCSPRPRASPHARVRRRRATRLRSIDDRDARARAHRAADRTVAHRGHDRDIDGALLEAAAAEGFDVARRAATSTRSCTSCGRSSRRSSCSRPRPGRSLDDLAADARERHRELPRGRDRRVRHHGRRRRPTRSGRRSPTGWCGRRRSRTCARSCGRGCCGARVGGRPPRCPANESERLAALWNLGILDTEPEARFDRYTEVACSTFDVPIALVTLVDAERQWFKSHHGIDVDRDPPRRVDVRARHPRRRRVRDHRRAARRPLRRQPVRRTRAAAAFLRRRAAHAVRRAPRRHALHHGPPTPRARRHRRSNGCASSAAWSKPSWNRARPHLSRRCARARR